jgi:hypothetical protein
VFLIGTEFENPLLAGLVNSARSEAPDLIERTRNSISIHRNVLTQQLYVICSSTSQDPSYFKYPWIDGMEKEFKSDLPLNQQ